MADAFVILERVGDGYHMKSTGTRGDALMFVNTVTVTSDNTVTAVAWANYTAAIMGFDGDGVDVRTMYMVRDLSDGLWYVHSDAATALGAAAFATILFVHRSLCNDETTVTKA